MRYTDPELWQLINNHPAFANYGGPNNDLRDRTEKDPSLSINLNKGVYFDHRTEKKGNLYSLAKSLGLLPISTQNKKAPPTPHEIWLKAKQDDDAVKLYFTKGRSIPENHYADILRLFRTDHYKGQKIIHPYFSFNGWQSELSGKAFDVPKIQNIWFDDHGKKTDKKHLGKTGETPVCFPVPPHNENRESKKAVILEGIESALSVRNHYSDSWLFVATCKGRLKLLPKFMEKFEKVLIIADHDFDKETYPDKPNKSAPDKTGQAEAWRLAETLKKQAYTLGKKKFSCKAVMPEQAGHDANDALRSGQLKEFIDGLEDIPEKFQSDEDFEGQTGLVVVRASTVKIKPIKWIWPGILAAGKFVLLAGDPGLGKSQVSLFICSVISNGGQWPVSGEIYNEKDNILILSAEDGNNDVIVPRLKAVKADLERIHIIEAVKTEDGKEKTFDLSNDVEKLEKLAMLVDNVKMIIIDPISAYLGKIDSHRNTEVRNALNPVIKFCEEIGACLLCVTHLNKGGGSGNALSRVTGSIAFSAAARASFVITRDPDNPDRRLMLPLKNNLAKDTHGFAYKIEEKEVSGIITTCVAWESDKINLSAEEVLTTQGGKAENKLFAEEFLREELKDGFEIPSNELYKRAEEHGISPKVLWNTKDKIGAKACKKGFSEGWVWYLPIVTDNEDSQNTKIPEDSLIHKRNLGGILAKPESSHGTFKETI
tara:strand:+ start:144 stop:2273 length:2130 start_codon:yes stop_codon:yes gene_type:complete